MPRADAAADVRGSRKVDVGADHYSGGGTRDTGQVVVVGQPLSIGDPSGIRTRVTAVKGQYYLFVSNYAEVTYNLTSILFRRRWRKMLRYRPERMVEGLRMTVFPIHAERGRRDNALGLIARCSRQNLMSLKRWSSTQPMSGEWSGLLAR
jgi:hypothetical protein